MYPPCKSLPLLYASTLLEVKLEFSKFPIDILNTIRIYCTYTVLTIGVKRLIIKLSNNSEKPIYEQITDQLKQAILTGTLVTGDALPSIRALAKELKISVMTTKRAYADLERDGFIETIAGKGSYVSERNQDFLREELIRQIEVHLTKAVSIATMANVQKEELHDLLDLLLEE